jgi:hypothetical protein
MGHVIGDRSPLACREATEAPTAKANDTPLLPLLTEEDGRLCERRTLSWPAPGLGTAGAGAASGLSRLMHTLAGQWTMSSGRRLARSRTRCAATIARPSMRLVSKRASRSARLLLPATALLLLLLLALADTAAATTFCDGIRESGLEDLGHNILLSNHSRVWAAANPCAAAQACIDASGHCELPSGTTAVGAYSFYQMDNLTSVSIPDTVTSIEDAAFLGCSSLTSVVIPDSVTSLGDGAFWFCRSLTSVVIGDSVTSIGESTFDDCSSLTSVTIGDSVTSIGYVAFSGCSSLKSVDIPDSVIRIEGLAFYGCSALTSVDIPDSVAEIAPTAFPPGVTVTGTGSPAIVCPFPSRCIDPHGCVSGAGGFACAECLRADATGAGERAHFPIGDRCFECPESSSAALLIVLSLVVWGLVIAGAWELARKKGLPLDHTCSDAATQDLRASHLRYRVFAIAEGEYTAVDALAAADGASNGWHMTEATSAPRTESCEDDWTRLSATLDLHRTTGPSVPAPSSISTGLLQI